VRIGGVRGNPNCRAALPVLLLLRVPALPARGKDLVHRFLKH